MACTSDLTDLMADPIYFTCVWSRKDSSLILAKQAARLSSCGLPMGAACLDTLEK